MAQRKRIFSGIQPTGNLNIGNYLGAMKNWLLLQQEEDCIFCIVDLHSQTVELDRRQFRERCLDFVALYLACGIDPERSIVFLQSAVPEHCQLTWILSCHSPYGDLRRMTQFKEKAERNKENVNAGLLLYPVLMAADILLYRTDLVPVGDDQKQHLELCRDLADRFNSRFGDVFVVPDPYIPREGARIKSLRDPSAKMSKTDPDPASYIALLDSPETIAKKIKRAVTGSGSGIPVSDDGSGTANLASILALVTGVTREQVAARYDDQGYAALKAILTDAVVALLEPIQNRYREIRPNAGYLQSALERGAEAAGAIAATTLAEVYRATGLT